jgi:hypothetical protein
MSTAYPLSIYTSDLLRCGIDGLQYVGETVQAFNKRVKGYRNRNRNKFINHIRAPGGHIQLRNMIDTQQQYIKLNIHGEVSIIVVQAHSGRKRDRCT